MQTLHFYEPLLSLFFTPPIRRSSISATTGRGLASSFYFRRLNRQLPAVAKRSVLQDFALYKFEPAVGIPKIDKTQNRHAIFLRRNLGIGTQKIRSFPQLVFFLIYGCLS
jgi:hypothetical protein